MSLAVLYGQHLDLSTTFAVIVVCAFITHMIFKYKEPYNPIPLAGMLLVALPSALSVLFLRHVCWIFAIPLAFFSFHFILAISIVVYRLSPFHPLASYPGPIPCKISKLWMYLQAKDGKQYLYIRELHKRYCSDIIRIGPNEVSIIEPEAMIDILGNGGVPKGLVTTARNLFPDHPTNLLNTINPEEHLKRRKPWARAFSSTALKDHETKISKRCLQLADRLAETSGKINLTHWIHLWSYDTMSDITYSGGSEMLRHGDPEGTLEMIYMSTRCGMIFEHMNWTAWFGRQMRSVQHRVGRFRLNAMRRAAARIAEETKTKDLYYYLRNEDIGKELRPAADVIPESVLATLAGTDTVSTASLAVFYLVLNHPDVYRRLQSEVDTFYPAGSDSTDPKCHKAMPFLEAVIHETLRLHPSTPSGSLRTITDDMSGRSIGTRYIPSGTSIRFHNYAVLRDHRNFSPCPDEFWPDRWLVANGQLPSPTKSFRHNMAMFIPFSYGPANCVGKNLALTELRILVCTMLQRFNMRFAADWDPSEWERNLDEHFALQSGDLFIEVECR
ncbi:high nitrogen upregulated cytochrome P450 monooxygenase 2 [Abortiporus biennis]|nr:high nitrogen upregulated cytochrome P450 monooxygenase 2 [Abortiporus biennis]